MRLYGSRTETGRTPTFALSLGPGCPRSDPGHLTAELNKRGVNCSHGNHYAVELVDKRLELDTGLTRLSFLHYNNMQEVDTVLEMIEDICKQNN